MRHSQTFSTPWNRFRCDSGYEDPSDELLRVEHIKTSDTARLFTFHFEAGNRFQFRKHAASLLRQDPVGEFGRPDLRTLIETSTTHSATDTRLFCKALAKVRETWLDTRRSQ